MRSRRLLACAASPFAHSTSEAHSLSEGNSVGRSTFMALAKSAGEACSNAANIGCSVGDGRHREEQPAHSMSPDSIVGDRLAIHRFLDQVFQAAVGVVGSGLHPFNGQA